MKHIKILIASVLVAVLLLFTALFVADAYNTGKIGNKDERVASSFTEDIQGIWKNTSKGTIASQLSSVSFGENGELAIVILGQKANGKYSDSYNLNTEKHTLTVKGNICGGLSIERDFDASLDDDKNVLTLNDTKSSLSFTLVRTDEKELTTEKTTVKTTAPKTEKSEADTNMTKKYSEAILGKWVSKLNSSSGYEFTNENTVKISLVGITTDGSYTLTADKSGKCELCIKYVSVAGVSVSNTYFVEVTENELTLIQKGAESISVAYTKAQ